MALSLVVGREEDRETIIRIAQAYESEQGASLVDFYDYLRGELEHEAMGMSAQEVFRLGVVILFAVIDHKLGTDTYLGLMANPEAWNFINGNADKPVGFSDARFLTPKDEAELTLHLQNHPDKLDPQVQDETEKLLRVIKRLIRTDPKHLSTSMGNLSRGRIPIGVDSRYLASMASWGYYPRFVEAMAYTPDEATDQSEFALRQLMLKNYLSIKLANQAFIENFACLEHWMHQVDELDEFPSANILASVLFMNDPGITASYGELAGVPGYKGANYGWGYSAFMRRIVRQDLEKSSPIDNTYGTLVYRMWETIAALTSSYDSTLFGENEFSEKLLELMRQLSSFELTASDPESQLWAFRMSMDLFVELMADIDETPEYKYMLRIKQKIFAESLIEQMQKYRDELPTAASTTAEQRTVIEDLYPESFIQQLTEIVEEILADKNLEARDRQIESIIKEVLLSDTNEAAMILSNIPVLDLADPLALKQLYSVMHHPNNVLARLAPTQLPVILANITPGAYEISPAGKLVPVALDEIEKLNTAAAKLVEQLPDDLAASDLILSTYNVDGSPVDVNYISVSGYPEVGVREPVHQISSSYRGGVSPMLRGRMTPVDQLDMAKFIAPEQSFKVSETVMVYGRSGTTDGLHLGGGLEINPQQFLTPVVQYIPVKAKPGEQFAVILKPVMFVVPTVLITYFNTDFHWKAIDPGRQRFGFNFHGVTRKAFTRMVTRVPKRINLPYSYMMPLQFIDLNFINDNAITEISSSPEVWRHKLRIAMISTIRALESAKSSRL